MPTSHRARYVHHTPVPPASPRTDERSQIFKEATTHPKEGAESTNGGIDIAL
jgi:hypothetical protein